MNIVTNQSKISKNVHSVKVSAYENKRNGEIEFVVRTHTDVGRISVSRETPEAISKIDFIGSAFELEMLIEGLQTAKEIYDREKGE